MADPPRATDALRSAMVVGTDILPYLLKLAFTRAASTNTEGGLAEIRASFGRTLRRLGVELEVLHAERVPASGGLVLMWNQESHLDHLVLASAIRRPFFSLYNNAVARVPFYGAHMRATGHVHVDRTNEAQWRPSVARAAARVRAGECVLVSPEGTRSAGGQLLPMKRGALMLAIEAASPVVCVTVVGGHARLPRGSAAVRPGPIRVVFSDPLEADDELAARLVETFEQTKSRHAVG
ncbi:MAG: 1-acyl-sn-glycerol-3-phosphate acyltransferase [Deltaproteobacteria bacterium]|nr:1-acyl-sn-glycerol-3-phosphate acyltransferase [Deltaproteobacteria bacterium]